MKKTLFLIMLFSILALAVNAQSRNQRPYVSLGTTFGLPVGNDSNFYNLVWGLNAVGVFPVDPQFGLLLDGGYVNYFGKSGVNNWGLIPILAGGKYNFSDKVFGVLKAGISFATSSGGGSAFTWTPGVGVMLTNKIALTLRYESASKNGWNDAFLGLRIGVSL
jgi:hypothetical protein